jgi:hypothetical protein
MTPTRDIGFLLARRDSEELASWKRKAELAKRQEVLRARMGRRLDGQTEVWTFDGAPAIQPTIRTCMLAAKAANKQESAWLDYADTAVQVAERTFKESLRTQVIPAGWVRINPKPRHITMGGPLGDIPQEAVKYLGTFSLNRAKDMVLRVLLGKESNEDPSEDPSDDEGDDEEPPAKPEVPKQSTPQKSAATTPTRASPSKDKK